MQAAEQQGAQSSKSRAIARRRAELAHRGVFECMGECRRTRPLASGIVVTWGGNVLLAICPECFPNTPIIMRRGPQGVKVEIADRSQWPADLVVAKDLSQLDTFVGEKALSKFKKMEL